MPDLDALPSKLRKPRDFLPERLGDRADYGHGPYVRKRCPRVRDDVSSNSELALPKQHEAILFRDLRTPHSPSMIGDVPTSVFRPWYDQLSRPAAQGSGQLGQEVGQSAGGLWRSERDPETL